MHNNHNTLNPNTNIDNTTAFTNTKEDVTISNNTYHADQCVSKITLNNVFIQGKQHISFVKIIFWNHGICSKIGVLYIVIN